MPSPDPSQINTDIDSLSSVTAWLLSVWVLVGTIVVLFCDIFDFDIFDFVSGIYSNPLSLGYSLEVLLFRLLLFLWLLSSILRHLARRRFRQLILEFPPPPRDRLLKTSITDRYHDKPLPPSHIRLLTISITDDDQLQATITSVRFDRENPPIYSALSYVWGSAQLTTPLQCTGNKPLYITPTLHEALRNVATHLLDQEFIWVDQICINQQDLKERSQQVMMMKDIYQCASKTLAYLGPSTPTTALAIDLISRLGVTAKDKALDLFLLSRPDVFGRGFASTAAKAMAIRNSEELGIPFSDITSWDAFTEFYDRHWFERIWIVQEMLLSRRGHVIVGKFSVSWDHVKSAALWYSLTAGAAPKGYKPSVRGIELTANMSMPEDWRGKYYHLCT